ncbi:YfiR family protein [Aliikangiella coralliicola]|uniref:YfiR family protein n=1 Tax=Aliikangiella coralliicola TaxID=2592383 RepID=A0A545UHN9_9GAMM|nr:YfiR family protein [Aliikangiella coralliicola]TQV88991.1 YfiR family protein [Aliikangiella coralliicola]
MKKATLVFICLVGICKPAVGVDKANENIARSLIVARLVSQIDWRQEIFAQKSSREFRLCVFDHYPSYGHFSKNLNGLSIRNVPIVVKNMTDRSNAVSCHVVYMNKPSNSEFSWFIKNNAANGALLVAEGRGYADRGAHLGLYIGKSNDFDFELNPDAFVQTQHKPPLEIFSLGKIVNNSTERKTQLMRSLINYTEWPGEIDGPFVLCSFQSDVFSVYSEFLLNDKSIKGRSVQTSKISKVEDAKKCHALILGEADEGKLRELVYHRDKLGGLLIGNAQSFGEKGTHYNLVPLQNEQNHRFEINLFAFEQTGHSPHFQLFNSAVVIEKDFPIFTQLLINLIQQTNWPGEEPKLSTVNLCIYRGEKEYDAIRYFLPVFKTRTQKIKLTSIISEDGMKACNAVLFVDIDSDEIAKLFSKSEEKSTLLITSRRDAAEFGIHYNLLVAAKRFTFELFSANLRGAGFVPQKTLIESGVVIGGNL